MRPMGSRGTRVMVLGPEENDKSLENDFGQNRLISNTVLEDRSPINSRTAASWLPEGLAAAPEFATAAENR
jgi:hypothetical protein